VGRGKSNVFVQVKPIDAIPRDIRFLNQSIEDFELAGARGHDDACRSSISQGSSKCLGCQSRGMLTHAFTVGFNHNIDDFFLRKSMRLCQVTVMP
jgi:hypothetical protein